MCKCKFTGLALGLGLLLFSSASMAKIIIPLNNKFLNLDLDDSYQLKKKCDGHAKISCYEIWSKNVFLSVYISDLSENRFLESNFKQVCKSKIDLNKFKIKYCHDKKTQEIFFLKNKHLITFSFKAESKLTLKQVKEIIDGVQ